MLSGKLGDRLALALGTLMVAGAGFNCQPQRMTSGTTMVDRDVERQIASLEALWAARSPETEASLVEPTRQLILANPRANSVDQLRLYLATHLTLHQRYAEAERLLAPVVSGRSGIAQDEAIILLAEIRTAEGRGDDALNLLTPVGRRLLTDEARGRHAEAMVRAALGARRWRLGVEYLVHYLSEAREGSEQVRAFALDSLRRVPLEAKRRLLEDWPRDAFAGSESEASESVFHLLVEGLMDLAEAQKDARLARDLIELGPPWVRRGERGEKLQLLGALAIDRAQVRTRKVGTVLGAGTPLLTRRTIELTSGVTDGLDAATTLITEDDRGSLADALLTLLGQGAGVLITGVDEASAAAALDFAEFHEVPVIVLSAPRLAPSARLRFGFILGESKATELEVLTRELTRRGGLAGPPVSILPITSCEDGEPLPQPPAKGIPILVLGDMACAEKVEALEKERARTPLLGLGLEAAPFGGAGNFCLRAGSYPRALHDLESEGAHRESWYRALGRDAAHLATRALKATQLPSTSDQDSTVQYRRELAQALAGVRAELETTDARGFDESHRLPRTLGVTRVE